MAGVANGPHGIGQGQVAELSPVLQVVQEQVHGRYLEQGGTLSDVGVTDDDVHASVALGIGMRFVPGVDKRPGTGRG